MSFSTAISQTMEAQYLPSLLALIFATQLTWDKKINLLTFSLSDQPLVHCDCDWGQVVMMSTTSSLEPAVSSEHLDQQLRPQCWSAGVTQDLRGFVVQL